MRVVPGIYHYSAWQNINVGVWVGQATLEATKGLIDVGMEMRRRYPAGHSSIVFILDKLPAPTPEARELFSQFFRNGSSLMCNAIVLEGEGFWASGLRAMINNAHRSASGSTQVGVGVSIDEILTWFPAAHARCTGIMVTAAELKPVLQEIRRQAGWSLLEWREQSSGDPAAIAAAKAGFGFELIRESLPYEIDAKTKIELTPLGLECEIAFRSGATENERPDDDSFGDPIA